MIVVKVELHSAITREVSLLGQAVIANVGNSPDGKRRNYDVMVGRKGKCSLPTDVIANPLRKGLIRNFPSESYNVWRLVIRALKSAFPEEK